MPRNWHKSDKLNVWQWLCVQCTIGLAVNRASFADGVLMLSIDPIAMTQFSHTEPIPFFHDNFHKALHFSWLSTTFTYIFHCFPSSFDIISSSKWTDKQISIVFFVVASVVYSAAAVDATVYFLSKFWCNFGSSYCVYGSNQYWHIFVCGSFIMTGSLPCEP